VATNSIHIDAPPERAFEVLSDARCYPEWVVGAKDVRFWDPEFPAPGTAFHHTFMLGPIPVKDSTSVLESDPPRRLRLRARARPTGVAHVTLELRPADGGGTDVVMHEKPVEGPPAWLHNPVQDWLIKRRNDESLRRLKRLAERAR
jgi:uncharacterized protein YndB with AHSA1/START domain